VVKEMEVEMKTCVNTSQRKHRKQRIENLRDLTTGNSLSDIQEINRTRNVGNKKRNNMIY
tara:strand:+ start:124 stop:303 length:180 start_codon:yes stop_codon:yes gene_type:complete